MGDILHALPAVTALRQAHPEWVDELATLMEQRLVRRKALMDGMESGPKIRERILRRFFAAQ